MAELGSSQRRGRLLVVVMAALAALAALALPITAAGAAKTNKKKTPTPIEALHAFSFTFSLNVTGSGSGALSSLSLDTEGAYVAPSSQDCTATASLGSLKVERQAVVIGKKIWVDSGDGLDPAKKSDFDFASQCPSDPSFWKEFDLGSTSSLQGEPETKNGIKTVRVDLGTAASQLSQLGIFDTLPSDVTVDTLQAWRAVDGGWIAAIDVGLTASTSDTCDSLLGDSGVPVTISPPCTVHVSYEISDANSKSVKVTPPKSSGTSK